MASVQWRGVDPSEYKARNQKDTDFSVAEMISNVPGSAINVVDDMVTAVANPIDTAKTIGGSVVGGLQKIPGVRSATEDLVGDQTKYADAIADFYSDRYGSTDQFLQSLEQDPVGVLADAATIFTLGAGLPGKVGQMSGKIGSALDPTNVAINTGKAALGSLPESVPRKMYGKATKFGTTLPTEQRNRMIDTALQNQIKPTQAGLDKLNNMIAEKSSEVDALIGEATRTGKQIPVAQVFDSLRELLRNIDPATMVGYQDRAQQVRSLINERIKGFAGRQTLSPDEVQALKRSLDKQINYLAIERAGGKNRPGTEDAARAMRADARQALEDIDPSIRQLNRDTGDLINLRDRGLTQAASRIENRDVIGAGPIMTIGPGGVIGGDAGAAAGAVVALGQYPKIQSNLALYIDKMRRSPKAEIYFDNNNRLTAAGRLALINATRVQEELDRQ